MPIFSIKQLANILGVNENVLVSLDKHIAASTGKTGILEAVFEENAKTIEAVLKKLNGDKSGADYARGVLRRTVVKHERLLETHINKVPDHDVFGRMAMVALKMVKTNHGHFLRKELIKDILLKRPPPNLLKYLGYNNVEELVLREDLTECFSALRFIESDEWMHKTFDEVYGNFTPDDFEEREIELRVLGPKWHDISLKFVAKKHHNVSHLKEFGVIFLNPVMQDIPGKLLRDFALLLHYFHEIIFYSKLFHKNFSSKNFSERFKSLLRGDVNEVKEIKEGEWLIVQRYLWKENPDDPRLRMPRVNPESLHWARGERDLANYFRDTECCDLEIWGGLDWVGGLFPSEFAEDLVSFDLEDNAMALVSVMEGKEKNFTYHQREAMWTKIFAAYAGGEEKMEKMLIDNFEKGVIRF
ncbi:hypothetical protein A3A20_00060 [Candidatus Wolfebacteria bacterium RIFCSPLOWO2_01_FULL_45_19]|uniref:Uncharacterized protein n=1 Tax=Candidatus Wolfebacteria bacterium RIFCSPLOWO2_01_FULL_45_19 TaxID=1802557 RepID=A0A1F8DT09_9BACT|nr:MAG: hypothetical protein A3A20_00060 [Candidatus Wolfebacteria bacterium RIFCSPLOWO2_01_FULL_45_19]